MSKKIRYKNPLPQKLLDKHPDLNQIEIKIIRTTILSSYVRRVKQARMLEIAIPHLGTFHTHRNKVRKYAKRVRKKDRKRKREEQFKKELTIDKLLF